MLKSNPSALLSTIAPAADVIKEVLPAVGDIVIIFFSQVSATETVNSLTIS